MSARTTTVSSPQNAAMIGLIGPNTSTYSMENYLPPLTIDSLSFVTVCYYFTIYFYTFVVFFSLFINIFFMLILTFRMQFYKRPFYRIVWQLILANLFKSIANATTTIPVTFFLRSDQSKVYVNSTFYKIISYFDIAGDQLIVWITLLIALSRLCVFVFTTVSDKVFSGKVLNIIILLVYVCAIAFSLIMSWNGCNYKFIKPVDVLEFGYLQFTCSGILNKNYWKLIEGALIGQAASFPFLGLICYIILFIEIARRRDGWRNTKPAELEILKQALLLFAAFEISIVTGYILMTFSTTTMSVYLVRMLVSSIELLAGVVTPLFFFITSREIRECAVRLNPLRVHISVSFSSKKVTQLNPTSSSLSGPKSLRRSLFHSVS